MNWYRPCALFKMTKPTRCVNFSCFSMFSSTPTHLNPEPLPPHTRLYNRFFCHQNYHMSGYDVLVDTPSNRTDEPTSPTNAHSYEEDEDAMPQQNLY